MTKAVDLKSTHILWAGRRMGRRAVELLECGTGWIDSEGQAHYRFNRAPFDGFTGYAQLVPRGAAPAKLPIIEPRRPVANDETEDDLIDVLDRAPSRDGKFTHLLFGARRLGRRFIEMLEMGVGWIDEEGVPHQYFNRTPWKTFTGYTKLVPRDKPPEQPAVTTLSPDTLDDHPLAI